VFHDFMKRDCVAFMRKTKIPIPAESYKVLRNFAETPSDFGSGCFTKIWNYIYNLNSSLRQDFYDEFGNLNEFVEVGRSREGLSRVTVGNSNLKSKINSKRDCIPRAFWIFVNGCIVFQRISIRNPKYMFRRYQIF